MKRLITLCTLSLIFSLSSCASFKRCKQKFGSTATDSVRVPVPVSVLVPRDSVITSFVTDTTYLYKEIQQGRAKLIVERTNSITTVEAKCDTVTITKTVYVKVPGPRVVWGVHPQFKTGLIITSCLLITSLLFNLINLKNENKRRGDTEPETRSRV